MASKSYWIRVGGRPLSETVAWSPPTWETLADGGCGQASFQLSGSRLAQVRTIRVGAQVDLMVGSTPLYAGEVADFDPGSGEVSLVGVASLGPQFMALDSANNVTKDTLVAVSEAANRGWHVATRNGLFGVVTGGDDNLQTVTALLDTYAEQTGQRWGVDGRRRLYMRADPTVPKYIITPGAIALSSTTEGAVSHYVVLYSNGTSNVITIAPHPSATTMAHREEVLDLTSRGALTPLEVKAITDGLHARSTATPWASGATIPSHFIRTIGDTPAALMGVRAGEMVRVMSAIPAGGRPALWFDVVIGKTSYTAGGDTIYIEPANSAPRTFVAALAAT